MPLTKARMRWAETISSVRTRRLELTDRGKPVAVLMSVDDYEELTRQASAVTEAQYAAYAAAETAEERAERRAVTSSRRARRG